MRYTPKKLDSKRKQRINRLVQMFGLLDHREEVNRVWGWNARRRAVHSLVHWQPVAEPARLTAHLCYCV
jgi:hypothetical protein